MASADDQKGSNFIGSLFSRLRKPFAQKARSFELSIQLDDPHRQYGPGDFITGHVVLRVTKAIDITHIVVCLHGYVQVYKTPNNPGAKYREYNAALVMGKTAKAGGYYGNGFASLFEDEVVLCGDGRIPEGLFRFGFELHFPNDQMPTSIDFERGTVSYMITTTLTRPSRASIINPITAAEVRVAFEDLIDISTIAKPKPRLIALRPIARRTKTRSKKSTMETTATLAHGSGPDPAEPTLPNRSTNNNPSQHAPQTSGQPSGQSSSQNTGRVAGSASSNTVRQTVGRSRQSLSHHTKQTQTELSSSYVHEQDLPQSPGTSEDSFETRFSSGNTILGAHSPRTGKSALKEEESVVTTQVDIQQAGYLRGDLIEIKISISHYKHIKSLHGIIATLYRQARVDMHPALPLLHNNDNELFIRQRSSLGGLSLSAIGTSNQFRKDLDQNWAPILINQDTFSADAKVNLCVPESAFPTISTAPGGMISFKYFIEVLIDVNGKLAALDKYLPTPNFNSVISRTQGPGAHASFHQRYPVDTEDIRRVKSVVTTTFEITIGTRDSSLKTKWQNQKIDRTFNADLLPTHAPDSLDSLPSTRPASAGPGSSLAGYCNRLASGQPGQVLSPRAAAQADPSLQRSTQVRQPPLPPHSHHSYDHLPAPHYDDIPAIPPFLPLRLPEEIELNEKARLHLAEQSLLPSAPPTLEHYSFAAGPSNVNQPSAPPVADIGSFTPQDATASPSRPSHLAKFDPSSSRFRATESSGNHRHYPNISNHVIPSYAPDAARNSGVRQSEDKQELERRRLEAFRSAPGTASVPRPASVHQAASVIPVLHQGAQPSRGDLALNNSHAPSAPFLTDEDIFGFNPQTNHELPRYER